MSSCLKVEMGSIELMVDELCGCQAREGPKGGDRAQLAPVRATSFELTLHEH